MNLISSFKSMVSSALCAALVGCASSADTATQEVVRTPPPRNYEKTITDYLAFKIRNQPKNAEVNVGAPEPGACALDAYTTSSRGWVVPVTYLTRTGEATGKETIRINTKQYYFWFLGSTIAGITPRIELCPGNGSGFEAPPNPTPATLAPTALPISASGAAESGGPAKQGAGGDLAKQTKTSGAKKATPSAQKSASSSKAQAPVKKKAGQPGSKTPPS